MPSLRAKWAGLGLVALIVVLVATLLTRSVGQVSGQVSGQVPGQSGQVSVQVPGQVPGQALQLSPSSAASPAASPLPVYNVHNLPTSLVHTLMIPTSASDWTVLPVLTEQTASLETFSQRYSAFAVLNGGFFDPQNQQTTSHVMQQGVWVGDPRQNARLMQNPDLTPYLDQILDRSELRRYRCSDPERIQFAIARHQAAVPASCQLLDALGAGPQLLPELTLEAEGFTATNSNGAVIRDALGSSQPNARTAVGILPDGSLLWVMAAQKPGLAASGLTLPELANFLGAEGVKAALNLDGGSSSGLLYNGEAIYGKLDQDGNPVVRPVKSVLLLRR